MAKYVVAGKSDCPFYARVELLADELEGRLDDFKVHKIPIQPNQWNDWVKRTCSEKKWEYNGRSPIIWRELLDRGGKGTLLGSCNEFLEMAKEYYGLTCLKMTEGLKNISEENKLTKDKDDAIEKGRQERSHPIIVCIIGAANKVAYQVILALCNGEIFANDEEIAVNLFDSTENQISLSGIAMEILDCASNQLRSVIFTDNQKIAFKDADLVIMLDGFSTKFSNDDDIKAYFTTFGPLIKHYGQSIDKFSKKSVKILVAGGPVNSICKMLSLSASSIPQKNFFALSRLQENITKGLIAKRLQIKTSDVKNVIIWGQPFFTQLTDFSMSQVVGYDGAIWGKHIKDFSQSTSEIVHDDKWLRTKIEDEVKQKNDLVLNNENGTGISRAVAIISQLRDLFKGQEDSQEIFSLGLISQGWYNVPKGLVFSFPVRLSKGDIEIVLDLEIDEMKQLVLKDMTDKLKIDADNITKNM